MESLSRLVNREVAVDEKARVSLILKHIRDQQDDLNKVVAYITAMRDSTERDLGITVRTKSIHENKERVDRLSNMIEAGQFFSDDIHLNSRFVSAEIKWLEI